MKNQYVFIIEPDSGERKATYLVGVHGTLEEILQKAADEYPNDTPVEGNDELFNDLVGKNMLYIDGHCVERPPYVPPLDDVKAAKIAEFKSIRDTKEVEPVQTMKGIFDYDDKSRDRLSIARQSLADNPSVESIVWTTADNQRVAMTIADFAEINSMAAYRSNQLHVKYNELKEQVNACTTAEQVAAITWE